jgi:hypothetical protein
MVTIRFIYSGTNKSFLVTLYMKIDLDINMPLSMSSISLGQYQEYLKVTDGVDDSDESLNFLKLKMLDIFCGVKLKESYKLPIVVFDSVIDKVVECLSEKTPLSKKFYLELPDNKGRVDFGFIPNLYEMTFGEYIDLDNYISDMQNLHKAMSVLYRPIVKSHKDMYSIREYDGSEEYANLMKEMPLNVALGALVFFYRLGSKLSRYTTASSLKKIQENPAQSLHLEKMLLEQSGLGINQYMHLLTETSHELMRLPHSHSQSA